MRVRALVATTSILALVSAASVAAQTAKSAADTAIEGEIIVTAQKRSESVQNVPISITALTGETLAASGIQDTERLSTLTPGLIVQRSVVGKISIRGVGNENYTISGDPGVAVHSDGVYVARAAAGLFDLFDINRVEVLRGPQGTLYGRNATGGVINVLPNTPDASALRAGASGEYGNYNYFRLEGMVNAPLGGGWAARVAGLWSKRDGFTNNTNADAIRRGFGGLDSKDIWAVRGQVAYDGDGPLKARLSVEYLKDDSNLPAYKYLNRPDALPKADFGGFGPEGLRTVNQGIELQIPGASRGVGSDSDVFKTHQFGASLHLDYDFGGVTLSSITGYRDTKFNYLDDGDGSDVFYVNYIQQDKSKQFSQELQLAGNFGNFDWLVGGFYFHETGSSFIALPFPFGFNLPFFIQIDGTARTDALAGFGELRWQATDRLKFTFGGRYSHEKRAAAYRYEVNFGVSNVANPDLEATFNAFTPRFVVDFKATDHINLYASATRGFKSGGFNLLAVQPGFDPEKVWSYEAGFKSTFAGGKGSLYGNVFYYNYKDIQVGQIVNLSSVLTNAAKATVKGAEIEFLARPVTGLEIGATVAYLDAKYDRFCTGDPTQPSAPVNRNCSAANPIDLAGNRFPRAPEWTVTTSAQYTADFGNNSSLMLRADLRSQSLTYFTQFNRRLVSQPAYEVVNGRINYILPGGRFSIGAFVNNVFNKTYFNEVLESGAFNPQLVAQAYVAPPRTYGITAGAKF
jgi:iron complex outermembrane receptor protein